MAPFLRSLVLSMLLALPLLMSVSCSSKKEEPAPTTGAIEGTVSPAGALTTVTATNAGGLTFLATPNPTTGAFSLPSLVPGTYTLSFTPASGYAAPATRTATVTAGQTTAAGTIVVPGDGTPRGTMSWTLGGTTYTATVLSGSITNQLFSVEAATVNAAFTDRISLFVPQGIGSAGTYDIFGSGPSSNIATYLHTAGALSVPYTTQFVPTGPTTGLAGGGTLVVSSYDAASRTMSGTFSFQAYSTYYGLSNVVWADITNGTFNLRF